MLQANTTASPLWLCHRRIPPDLAFAVRTDVGQNFIDADFSMRFTRDAEQIGMGMSQVCRRRRNRS
jgi:hypothetical protein